MARIALFGGSFSPVHIGHMEVAKGILCQSLADEVWMMPCRQNPLKDGAGLMDDETRKKLLEKAAKYYEDMTGENKIKVIDIELGMPVPSYTADTLLRLTEIYPAHEFRLVVGADSYLGFSRWKDSELLEKNYNPIIYPRPGYHIEMPRPGWTKLENVRQTDISSTKIRELMEKGADCRQWMPWI